jgi:hypothetical protein
LKRASTYHTPSAYSPAKTAPLAAIECSVCAARYQVRLEW